MRDGFKPLDEIFEPDIRNSYFVRIHRETGMQSKRTIEDHYQEIAQFGLEPYVDESAVTQFDVARNVFIYRWFEYRFFNVAEQKALTVLEYALSRFIGGEALAEYIKAKEATALEEMGKPIRFSKGLKTMIQYCADII